MNSIVEITDRYKYLGVILNGSLKHACDDLVTRARKAFFALKRKLCLTRMLLKHYNSIIVQILSYFSEIWISDFKANPNNFVKNPEFYLEKHLMCA